MSGKHGEKNLHMYKEIILVIPLCSLEPSLNQPFIKKIVTLFWEKKYI